MKATGIVRRIDDLGRVVIPKEIRRTLRLREGTPLEIFTDREGEIILKKYSPMVELAAFAVQYAEAMAQSTGLMDCIGDYSFDVPLKEGGRLVFGDMALYTMVKNNTFNGMPLPSIVYRHEDGTAEVVRAFGYEDFVGRL